MGQAEQGLKLLAGPKYDGKYLHNLLREKVGKIKLHQTLTNVVIPTFDIKLLQPTVFSSYAVSFELLFRFLPPKKYRRPYLIQVNDAFFLCMVQVKNDPSLDAVLADVGIGTSAAPTFLPAHYFETKNSDGSVRKFNLIDGGVAANNPVFSRSDGSTWCSLARFLFTEFLIFL